MKRNDGASIAAAMIAMSGVPLPKWSTLPKPESATLQDVYEEDLPEDPMAILNVILSELQPQDSFGVYGSDFTTCQCCEAGGSPYRNYEHTAQCPVGIAEEALQKWAWWNWLCGEFEGGSGI
jgi:hypothetical protein